MNTIVENKVELKYCERCGGLWLRREGDKQVYCVTCAPEMQQLATPRRKPPVSIKSIFSNGGVVCA